MTLPTNGPIGYLRRSGLLAGLALAALAAGGCERALQVAPSSSTLALTAAEASVPLNGSITVTATVTNSGGAAIADGTLVTFASTLGTIEPREAYTSNGRATVRLNAGAVSGTARVSASSGGVQASALDIRVGSVPTRVVLTASQANPGSVTLVATVFDAAGGAVTGVPVAFATTAGTLGSTAVTTDGLGQAANTLYGTSDAVVTATVSGVQASIAVRFGAGGTLSVNITMNPSTPQRRQTVAFTANVTGFGGSAVFVERYEWDFGNGQVFVTTGNSVSKAYDSEGQYGVTLRVYAVGGAVGISRIEFWVD